MWLHKKKNLLHPEPQKKSFLRQTLIRLKKVSSLRSYFVGGLSQTKKWEDEKEKKNLTKREHDIRKMRTADCCRNFRQISSHDRHDD